jgi:hypothetical protein
MPKPDPDAEKLTMLIERMATDRLVLLGALTEVQRVAAWMIKRAAIEPRGCDEILNICENALAQLAVPGEAKI